MITPLTFAAPFIVLAGVMEEPATIGGVLAAIALLAVLGLSSAGLLWWLLTKLFDSDSWRH